MDIPLVTVRKNKIAEKANLAQYESGPIWIQDSDAKRGREINFRTLGELGGLYEIYLDAELRYEDDVADSITAGASFVTVSEKVDQDRLKRMLFLTDSLILYVRENPGNGDLFIKNGGRYVYSDKFVIDGVNEQFSKELRCSKCNLIIPIGEFNGRGNKEASSLS
jgi:hypothetical protein